MKSLRTIIVFAIVILTASVVRADMPDGRRQNKMMDAINRYEGQRQEAVRQISTPAAGGQYSSGGAVSAGYDERLARKTFEFEGGYEDYRYKYEETVGGEHFMDLKSPHYRGFFGALTYAPPNPGEFVADLVTFYRFEGRMAWGKPDYNGAVVNLNTGEETPVRAKGARDFVFELRGVAGKDYWVKTFRISPYAGLGYRHLRQNNDKEVSDTFDLEGLGYTRVSQYVYLPLGIDVKKALPARSAIGLNVEFDWFLYGEQRSQFGGYAEMEGSGEIREFSELRNKQREGYGLRGSVRFEKSLGSVDLVLEPFIRYWDIEKSELAHFDVDETGTTDHDWVLLGANEPSNTTKEAGVRAGLQF